MSLAETAPAPAAVPPVGRVRWIICGLLFLATTINYIDRQILALVKEFLDIELGWTNEQFGMVNSAFQGAYAVGLLLFGWFVDRYGTKIGYAVSIVLWSLAAIGHAAVGSVAGFFVARMALGGAEGGNFPSAIIWRRFLLVAATTRTSIFVTPLPPTGPVLPTGMPTTGIILKNGIIYKK
jgi:ACS family hexuronate transporter-like MFS transporter